MEIIQLLFMQFSSTCFASYLLDRNIFVNTFGKTTSLYVLLLTCETKFRTITEGVGGGGGGE